MPEETAPKKRGRQKAQASPAAPTQGEMVVSIPLTELHPFPNHPFQVRDDEAMQETAESVKEYGVLVPAIARPLRTAGMRSSRATGANMPASWRGWTRCRS